MGGKSRKTGTISRKLVQRLVKEHIEGMVKITKRKKKKKIEAEKEKKEGFGFNE